MNNDNAANGDKQDQSIVGKGVSLEKIMSKFEDKLGKEKSKAFEQKFSAKYKELDSARAVVKNIEKELEKMYTEFNEGL